MNFIRKTSIKPTGLLIFSERIYGRCIPICFNSTFSNSTYSGPDPVHKRQVVIERELPDVVKEKWRLRAGFLGFAALMAVSLTTIIKYEEVNAPVVTSTLYTLRRSDIGRRELGDNIQFSSFVPWIHGKIQAAKGIVDVGYYVSGDSGSGYVHFEARRSREFNRFVVVDWSLQCNGITYDLKDEEFHPFVPGRSEEPTMRPSS